MSAESAASSKATTAAGPVPPTGGRTVDQYRDAVDSLRNRVDLFGKTLAGLATVGTGAVGLAKVGDLFPNEGEEGWVWAAVIGLLAAAAGAVTVAVRLMNVSQPLVIDPDLDATDWRRGERSYAAKVFRASANRFGYDSLVALQQRERVLRSVAGRASNEAEQARRTTLADEVKLEIEGALARTQLVIVRRRATRAVCGMGSILCYVLVATGLVTFALGTDAVSSSRQDDIAIAKSCGEARAAGATKEELQGTACSTPPTASEADVIAIAKSCGEARAAGATKEELQGTRCTSGAADSGGSTPPPTRNEARAALVTDLVAAWATCAKLEADAGPNAGDRPLSKADCRAIQVAIRGLSAP